MSEEFKDIFYEVRNSFVWTADEETEIEWLDGTIKIADQWKYMEPDQNGVYRGDCEDFCLTIDKIIKERLNIPLSERKLTYCVTETGEGHMILEVQGQVFDNRQRKLTTLKKLKSAGYKKFAQPVDKVNGRWKYL